jgi:hypothetical protein
MTFRRVVGITEDIPVRDEPHPVLPDWSLYAGRGGTAYYEPPVDGVTRLQYRQNDVDNGIRQIVIGTGLVS